VKRKEEKVREKTAREKALEFAKNVPRPRIKTNNENSDYQQQYSQNS